MANKNSRSKIAKRREQILELLQQSGKVYIAELSELFSTSLVTIRSDLDALAQDGKLVRMAGGAVACGNAPQIESIINHAQKKDISRTAANLIQDGDTLFINSGTTTRVFAEALKHKKNLNVVTNSLSVATLLGSVPSYRVILLGGAINSQYGFTYGADTQELLNRYGADWAILSVDGVSDDGEISTCHAEEAIIDRIMINRAKSVLVLADETKIGRTGFTYVCSKNEKIKILTNKKL